jgi:L-2-hydroxyglutarate oxidase LhgO
MYDSKITIIGAGVIGLAIASKLSKNCDSLFVIERNKLFGQETSSRNSEVIHAGIYYPKESLKAKLCVEGKKQLYKFCDKYEIPYSKCGKLIVATTTEEIPILDDIKQKALNSGVDDLIFLNQKEITSYEPNIFALAALFSPSTGIIESHSYMKQLETISVNNGAEMVYGNEVVNIKRLNQAYEITLKEPDGTKYSFTSEKVINAAGLESDLISGMLGLKNKELKIQFCKGQYFRVNPPKNKLVSRLVYPVPNPNLVALGIHVTVDLSKGVKLGPDVKYLNVNKYDYKVDLDRKEEFYTSVKRFLPFIERKDLSPEMAGLRPKIQKEGEEVKDFYIQEESNNGLSGFINLIGIESPGLTASLAIADYIEQLV